MTIIDKETGEEALIIIRYIENRIGICLSLEKGADVEVFLDRKEYNQFMAALEASSKNFETEDDFNCK